IQNLKSGETILEDVPAPRVRKGHVLIKTRRSLVSLGTERMLVEFGKAGLIAKARQQPDKVKMVLDKIKSDGLIPTLEAVFNKLEQPLPLGYCNVGEVIDIGEGVTDFKVGDRVASNGQHAEFVCIPQNLAAHIPDNVSDEEAVFTVIGSIGLQGIRLLNPTFGETVVVIGMGLIGLITAELLMANGCRVIGVDLDNTKLQIAKEKGIFTVNPTLGTDPVKYVEDLTGRVGADGVIITASAKTDDIISQAARMSRKRGRIILVGVIGLQLNRAEFYEKELTFQVSCSYGPGRYDDNYEQKGQDYPLSFVRWTEKRNFQAILEAIATKRLDVQPLISEQIPLQDYDQIYGSIGQSPSIASILVYPADTVAKNTVQLSDKSFNGSSGVFGIIGAGNFTKMTMLPILKKIDLQAKYISSAGGVNATALAKKYGIPKSTTNYREILEDPEVDTLILTTRHNLHAPMVIAALEAGKNVFVEKPLALTQQELKNIIQAYQDSKANLNVGFNRRFSPHIKKIKSLLNEQAPKNMIATMNAGFIPPEVWIHDKKVGGGRIIGEACHFIDLMIYLSGSRVSSVCMSALGKHPQENTDNACLLLKFENGDQGSIHYFANGHKSYSKERIEVYAQQQVFILDNFRKLSAYGVSGFSGMKTKLDKGHFEQFRLLNERAQQGGDALIPINELINSSSASLAAIKSLKQGTWLKVDAELQTFKLANHVAEV
ncbi:MAG: bi-domain-containing oxidoreductase, partial [Bacteroidota bacterium]